MSLKLSRPSSAASQRSQRSYVSNSSIISRFQNSKKDINLECKAAFLTVLDDIQEAITNKSDFLLSKLLNVILIKIWIVMKNLFFFIVDVLVPLQLDCDKESVLTFLCVEAK